MDLSQLPSQMKNTSFKKPSPSNELFLNEVGAPGLAQLFPRSCRLAGMLCVLKAGKKSLGARKAQGGQFHLAAGAASLKNALEGGTEAQGALRDHWGGTQSHPDHHIPPKSSSKLGTA